MTMTLLVGTTNTDGTGSAENLTIDNATQVIEGTGGSHGVWGVDLESLIGTPYSPDEKLIDASLVSWNKHGYKEVKVEGNVDSIYLSNFVDVHVAVNNDSGTSMFIENAKRGHIETGSGDDLIGLFVQSNNNIWSNHFTIDTGAGNDEIYLWDTEGSHRTNLNINAGNGDDLVDITGLQNADQGVTRVIDGGEGLDVFVHGGDASVDFKNFEVIQSSYGEHVELTFDDLNKNGNTEHGLVIDAASFHVEGTGYMEEGTLSHSDKAYLRELGYASEDFVKIWVFDDYLMPDEVHAVLTYDIDAF
ncbi:hypothetical protein [Vibrio nigripulchritudo]|uniref:hypothetical protein n=1 Tax=Vibrio nigripulchritudo TaxID=28173 RepID=UPI0003B1E707|nr:hypothetical protein [Vibrio nigripulchritudo]CCN69092.1 hypothetical protein VIBNISFn118_120032 [Vibrio nigripulchritudo SFn118]